MTENEWLHDASGYYKIKPAGSVLDYGHDFTDWLTGSETILTSTWSASTGITLASPAINGAVTSTLISGGTTGVRYTITNTITTATRTDIRKFDILVKDRID